jgi:hypothetical protein
MAWYKSSVKKHGWRGWQRNLALSKRGMAIGTEVHGLIESFINNVSYEITEKYPSRQLADSLYDVVNPKIDEYIALEPHLVSNELRLHGTADVIVRMNYCPGLWVGDWKTSYEKSETHPIQLAIYALMWNEQHPGQQIDQGWIARIDKKSKNLNVKIDEYKGLKKYYPVIRALRTIYDYTKTLGEYKSE